MKFDPEAVLNYEIVGKKLHTRILLADIELSFSSTATRSAGLLIFGNFSAPSAATRMVT